ncbi:MAG: hypothetical protein ACR2NX_02380 [Chthoniobacterales bacterium]
MPTRFCGALQETDENRDAKPVASLFAEDAKLSNLGGEHEVDANSFWAAYRAQFRAIQSEFNGKWSAMAPPPRNGNRAAKPEMESRSNTAG